MSHLQIAVVYCKISIFAYDTTIMNMERYIVGIGDALWDCLPENPAHILFIIAGDRKFHCVLIRHGFSLLNKTLLSL